MSRVDDIANLAAAICGDLADGEWRKAVGLGGWGHPPGLVSDALNDLLEREIIEQDARRGAHRLVPTRARQTTIYDTEG